MSNAVRRSAVAGLGAVLAAGLIGGSGVSPASAAPVRYEAEQATIINGTVASNHPGFTGSGWWPIWQTQTAAAPLNAGANSCA